MPYLGIFRLGFFKIQRLVQNWKFLNLEPKMTCLGVLGSNLKNHCYIRNQRPQICFIAKFGVKIKILKFGSKNVLIAYFWVRNLKIILSYLKSEPSSSSNSKFCNKTKNPKFGTKTITVIFKISTLNFVKNEFLSPTVNFGTAYVFLKVWDPLYSRSWSGSMSTL